MKIKLKPIKPKKISDQVFDQLRELIFRGEFKPGEQIMTERELAEALNVSRTSVRDAISKLVVMRLLEQRQGQGTFVRATPDITKHPLAIAMEAEDATLEDLLEVRMGLECNAAALAARRAVEHDLHFMQKSIDEMKVEGQSGPLLTQADISFHIAVAYAAHNPLQVYIMKNFYDFLFAGIKENLVSLYEKPANIEAIIAQHTEIYHTIRDHNTQEAEKAMKRHINFVLDFFKERSCSVRLKGMI